LFLHCRRGISGSRYWSWHRWIGQKGSIFDDWPKLLKPELPIGHNDPGDRWTRFNIRHQRHLISERGSDRDIPKWKCLLGRKCAPQRRIGNPIISCDTQREYEAWTVDWLPSTLHDFVRENAFPFVSVVDIVFEYSNMKGSFVRVGLEQRLEPVEQDLDLVE
jgi:hypothetical protein